MQSPPNFLWLLAVLLMALATGCALPLEPRFEQVSEFKPHGKGGGKEAGITLGLEMQNPNPYKIKLLAYDLDVFLNGNKVGDATHRGKQVMVGKSTSTIRIELVTDLKQIFGGLIGALNGLLGKKQALELEIKGTVVAKAKGFQKRVPVEFKKTLDLPD
jgi:LEA14-like dessication related protein